MKNNTTLLERFFQVIELATEGKGLTVSEIGEQWGITKNPTYYSLMQMVERGWITQGGGGGFLIPHVMDVIIYILLEKRMVLDITIDELVCNISEEYPLHKQIVTAESFTEAGMKFIRRYQDIVSTFRRSHDTTIETELGKPKRAVTKS